MICYNCYNCYNNRNLQPAKVVSNHATSHTYRVIAYLCFFCRFSPPLCAFLGYHDNYKGMRRNVLHVHSCVSYIIYNVRALSHSVCIVCYSDIVCYLCFSFGILFRIFRFLPLFSRFKRVLLPLWVLIKVHPK